MLESDIDMASNSSMIHKMQMALNSKGAKILYQTSQFYSEESQRAITQYHVKQAVLDETTGKHKNVELFKSTSQVQIVLFMRDLWYEINGWDLPTDNPMWEEIKRKNFERRIN